MINVNQERQIMGIDIPMCVRNEFSTQKLPSWLSDIFGLGEQANFSDIPADIKVTSLAEVQAINHFLQILFTRRIKDSSLKSKVTFPDSKLVLNTTVLTNLGLSIRTSNGMKRFISESEGEIPLNSITYGELQRIPAMGSKSIIEFLFKIENYAAKYNVNKTPKGALLSTELDGKEKEVNIEINDLIEYIESFENLDQIYRGDPRFLAMNIILPLENYKSGSTLEDLIQESKNTFESWTMPDRQRFKVLLSETFNVINYLNSNFLDNLFRDFIRNHYVRAKDKHLDALCNRFGINEKGLCTLEECGQQVGVTRERIRQIESKIYTSISLIPGHQQIYMPKIDEALNVIRNNLGSSLGYIQDIFLEKGIASIPLSISSILQFSSLLRISADDLKIVNVRNGEKIIAGDDINVNLIMMQAAKLYSRNGITDINLLYDSLLEPESNINYDDVKNIVRGSGRWVAIDEEKRWWTPANMDDIARNRLINITQKMLSTCNPIGAEDLRNGYLRAATFRNSSHGNVYIKNKIVVPTKLAILKFFNYIDGYTVYGDTISTDQYIDHKVVLGSVERGIVETLLTSQTGLMSRQELLRYCTEKGLNESSISMYLSFSPVVQHIGLDTYKIIGKETTAGSLSAHQKSNSEKTKTKRLLLCDWIDGMIRFVIRCPEFSNALVIGSPSSVKGMLSNKKFQAFDDVNNESCGTIGVTEEGTIYGMNTYCRKSGLEKDDILIMRFNLLESRVYLGVSTFDEYLKMID